MTRKAADTLVRAATPGGARSIHSLMTRHVAEGHLLPRTLANIIEHADRFVVATVRGRTVGCAELAPLSSTLAEIRSFVVSSRQRGRGVGRLLVDELRRRARRRGFEQLCAFTHAPAYFLRLDFSSVPHASVPEKIAADCVDCPQFGRCGQSAVVMEIGPLAESRAHTIGLRATQARL